jgi:hypothetical protein
MAFSRCKLRQTLDWRLLVQGLAQAFIRLGLFQIKLNAVMELARQTE